MHSATQPASAPVSDRVATNRARSLVRLFAVGLALLVATAALQHVGAAPAYGETTSKVLPSADAYAPALPRIRTTAGPNG